MLALLRTLANDEAQRALRSMNEHYIRTGKRDRSLDARYEAAERIVDAIDAYIAAEQVADPEAPDYFVMFTERDQQVITESELRLLAGDR